MLLERNAEFIGISEYQLAEVVESATVVDEILDEVREELGFSL